MSVFIRLLGIWLGGESVLSTTAFFMRLLSIVAAVAVLTAMAGMLSSLVLGGLLWLVYLQLVAHGLDEPMAILVTVVLALALLMLVILCLQHHFRNIEKAARRAIIRTKAPLGGVTHIADAFMDGFNRPARK